MPDDSKTPRKQRKYTAEQRTEALRLFGEGRGVGEISRMSGVPKTTLRRWRDQERTEERPGQADRSDRNANGTFKPNNAANLSGTSSALQRATAKLQDRADDLLDFQLSIIDQARKAQDSEDGIDRHLFGHAVRLSESLLDRAMGKPKQTQEVTSTTKFSVEDLAAADKDAAAILARFDEEEGA